MSLPALEIAGLGKRYDLKGREFWALRHVDLQVAPGEVLGIIGRNGAGESTLLKILARITSPTEGRARVRGRVGTLLETGTGMHESLSGRENIALNGTILGMSPQDIRARLDAIVEFSGVGAFIDTPVRKYSSGMKARLAFAVAAHLDTAILLVDEVLAVGDIAFRERCLQKMGDLTSGEGRTVLFVSHSLGAVQSLCSRAILLEGGELRLDDAPNAVIKAYRELMLGPGGGAVLRRSEGRKGSGALRIVRFELQDGAGTPVPAVPAGAPARLVFDYESALPEPPGEVTLTVIVEGSKGSRLFGLGSEIARTPLARAGRRGRWVCTVPRLPLLPGTYDLVVSCFADRQLADKLVNLCSLAVSDSDCLGTGRLPPNKWGDLVVESAWSAQAAPDDEPGQPSAAGAPRDEGRGAAAAH